MASSITLSSQIPIHTSSIAAQTKTYLNRCVEDLSPDKVKSFEKKVICWNVVSVVCTVAFFALAIGAFIATSVLATAYIPVAGISAILLAIPAVQQVQKFQKWSQEAKDEAEKYKRLQHHYADLKKQTPHHLQQLLIQKGIAWNSIPGIQTPDQLARLNPLLAQSKYLEERTQHWMDLRDKYANEAKTAEAEQKTGLHYLALQYEEEALRVKIQNAFTCAILCNPDFKGSLDDVATLSKNTYNDSILASALNDTSANQMLTFKNHLAPVSFNEVKTMSVSQLTQRIFSAMTTYTQTT
jgi:hypothetical protein